MGGQEQEGSSIAPKTILYLSRAVLPSPPTHTLSIMRMCQALADSGHRVVLLGWSPSPDAPDPIEYYGLRGGFRVERLCLDGGSHKLLWSQARLGMAARRLIGEIRADLVYSRLAQAEIFWLPRRVPIVYEMHSLGPFGDPRSARLFRWLMRFRNFRRIVATTDIMAKQLRERVDTEVVVTRLSAEPPIEIPADIQAEFRRQNLQGPAFRWHVGYTGALDRKDVRGTDIICKIAAEIPEAAFHVVGGEPQAVEYWRQFAKDWNRHGNLFFYGNRNPAQMPYFLGCFDVVLAPLKFRPNPRTPYGQGMAPLKLPQYMAYGKAIVASDLLAHREVLQEGETALLASSADVDAWVHAVKRLLKEPDLRARLGTQARARYFAEHLPEMRVARALQGL